MPSTLRSSLVPARRADVRLAIVGVLLASALAGLAWWQYRSVRQTSDAERDRMQALLASRATQFERDLDREVTRAFVWLQVDVPSATGEPRRTLADRLARWYEESPHPSLLSAIYAVRLAERPGDAPVTIQRFDRASRAFVDTAFPKELAHLEARFNDRDRDRDQGFPGRRFRVGGPIDPVAPALIVGRPWFRRGRSQDEPPRGDTSGGRSGTDRRGDASSGRETPSTDDPEREVVALVAVLDTAYISGTLMPEIAAEHFPHDERFAFRLRVTRVADGHPLFAWPQDAGSGDFTRPDAVIDLLRIRGEEFSRFMLSRPNAEGQGDGEALRSDAAPSSERIEIAVLQPRDSGSPPAPRSESVVIGNADGRPSAWRLALVHRDGSLDEAVARTRRWNLAASLGMLLILGAGMGIVLIASRRAQRLAHERLEFVAGVSHELRTPLSVIRSAAENLADGVVADRTQVQRYGQLIASEGRRLSTMVDDVMAFAGMEAGQIGVDPQRVEVGHILDGCLARVRDEVSAAGLTIDVSRPPQVPHVQGDPDALIRALVNLVTNAVKYAADGGWIGLAVDVTRERGKPFVRITVSDRGPGIVAGERARVFEPFFRGADAVTRQVHGNGLGLSLVHRTVTQHGGRVTLHDNTPHGCIFTILLPVAPSSAAATAALGNEAPAAR